VRSTSFTRALAVDRFRMIFNAPMNLASAQAGVTVTRGGVAVTGTVEADPNNDPKTVLYIHREGPVATAFPLGKYEVNISAATIKDVPAAGAPTRLLAGKPHSPDPPLPSEGAPGADDFLFYFTVDMP